MLAGVFVLQAMDYARKLRDDRGRGNIVVVDDGEETEEQMGEDEFQVCTRSLTVSSLYLLAASLRAAALVSDLPQFYASVCETHCLTV